MTEPETLRAKVDFLLKRRFGSLAPQPPSTLNGRSNTQVAMERAGISRDAAMAGRADPLPTIDQAQAEYLAMSPAEIDRLFAEARAEDARKREAARVESASQQALNHALLEARRAALLPEWAKQDLWSHAEFSEICCGRVPREPGRTDSDVLTINAASEAISRGTHSKTLQFVARDDQDTASRMYGTYRHYVPRIAAEWAAERFETFPLALLEAIRSQQVSEAEAAVQRPGPKLRSDREQNLLRVIAGLWALSELPHEPNTTADKLSALFDAWKWDKPAKGTIADLILKQAAALPGAAIRK